MSGTRTRIRLIRGRATRRYQAVLCDLFETLVTFDRAGLPEMRVGDRAVPSTVPMLVEILTERWVHPSPETILRMLIEVSDEMQAEKEADLLERSSVLRFARVLERLGAPDGVREVAFVERLVECHMEHLARCTLLPATHAAALERLARGHRLALVSDAVGKVKPHAELFEAPLARMGIAPSEALFVGDTPGADVLGAKQAGLDVAWINRKGRELDPDLPEPDLEIRSFAELPDLLI